MKKLFRELRRRAAIFVWPSIGMCVLGYFVYHLTNGDRGFFAWQNLVQQINVQESQLKEMTLAHDQLEHRVKLLRSEICPDLLDEQAKRVLGYVHPHDMIIQRADF